MIDWILILAGLFIVTVRVKSFHRLWNMPFAFGQDRFFGVPIPPESQGDLLPHYRRWLFVPFIPEALCILAILLWGQPWYLVPEQATAVIFVAIFHNFVAVHFIRKAQWLALDNTWRPVASVALSLRARRLADYTNIMFEAVLVLATAVSIVLLATDFWRSPNPANVPEGQWTRDDYRAIQIPLLMIYLQLGGLLFKHGLVKWRMWLPGERTEEYLQWREAALKYFLWLCDYGRALFTAILAEAALVVHFHDTPWDPWIGWLGLGLVVGTALLGTVGLVRRQRRAMALHGQLQPLEAFSRPPQPIDTREFFAGGLFCYKPENPSVFVPGPLVLALNLANVRAYVYSAYAFGLVFLVLWAGGIVT